MKITIDVEMPDGGSLCYEKMKFSLIPRIGEGIVIDDEGYDIEIYGDVTDCLWIEGSGGHWFPHLTVKANSVCGDGSGNFYQGEGE